MSEKSNTTQQHVIDYYKECWLKRFETGHNPDSLAMHLGYFSNSEEDNDKAKLNMNRFVAHTLGLKPDDSRIVVDAGCGVGGTLIYLQRHYPALKLIGVNISEEQLNFAKSKADPNGNISFVNADYTRTGLPSGYADAVYAVESVCHAQSKSDFFDEAYRLLKPGGLLIVLDYAQKAEPQDVLTQEQLRNFEVGWAVPQYLVNADLAIANSGFELVSVTNLNEKVLPGILKSYAGAKHKMATLNGHAHELERRHFKACIALKELVEKHIVEYVVFTAKKPV
jgi:tocopherol O-methyltransferase